MKSRTILYEVVLVTAVMLLGMWFLSAYKTFYALIPLAYLLIEKRIRLRSWEDLGFKFKTFWKDLRMNWYWFVLVAFISQPLVVILTKYFFLAYLEHIIARLPFDESIGFLLILPILATSLVLEELTYRTLIQGRLTRYIGAPMAILITSVLFGFAHYASGPFWIVFLDISMIIVDSILFGIIYKRGGNLVVTWLAHFIGDVLGLFLIVSL